MHKSFKVFAIALGLVALSSAPLACTDEEGPSEKDAADAAHAAEDAMPKDGKIAIPAAVVRNLGITFVNPSKRTIAATTYLTGVVEAPPEAIEEHHALFRGRISIAVSRYQEVKGGDLLATIAPLDRAAHQSDLLAAHESEATAKAEATAARLEQARLEDKKVAVEVALVAAEELLSARKGHLSHLEKEQGAVVARLGELEELNRAGGGLANELAAMRLEVAAKNTGLAEVREEIAETNTDLAERRGEITILGHEIAAAKSLSESRQAAATRAEMHSQTMAAQIAEYLGQPRSWLVDATDRFATILAFKGLEIRALNSGTVANIAISSGSIVEEHASLLTLIDRSRLVIRAHQPQGAVKSDLASHIGRASLASTPIALLSNQSENTTTQDPDYHTTWLEGALLAPLEAEARDRLADLIFTPGVVPSWLRPGLSMRLALQPRANQGVVLAIPQAALIRDGLETIYFLRDSSNPDKAMRMVADLGASDGQWSEVRSGLMMSDQLVLDGIYELKLASSASATKGGHFHADGTFHEGEH